MNWIIQVVRALSPNCQEAIRLQSDALDRPLSFWQRLGLRIHVTFCLWCFRYGVQILGIRNAAKKCEPANSLENSPENGLPVAARKRIKEQLRAGN
jgi:hypothetical protein